MAELSRRIREIAEPRLRAAGLAAVSRQLGRTPEAVASALRMGDPSADWWGVVLRAAGVDLELLVDDEVLELAEGDHPISDALRAWSEPRLRARGLRAVSRLLGEHQQHVGRRLTERPSADWWERALGALGHRVDARIVPNDTPMPP